MIEGKFACRKAIRVVSQPVPGRVDNAANRPHQGASALMALPLLLFERSRDHLARGSSHAWRYSRVANTSNSNRDAAAVDILSIFYVPIRSKNISHVWDINLFH